MISPQLTYAVRGLRKQDIKLGLNSNGLALAEELAKLIVKNFEYFQISLEADSPELYLKTHGVPQSAFQKAIDNGMAGYWYICGTPGGVPVCEHCSAAAGTLYFLH